MVRAGATAVILFKACPRCGGDIDVTYPEDVSCVQCGHRPEVVYPGPRIVGSEADLEGIPAQPPGRAGELSQMIEAVHGAADADPPQTGQCPRCGSLLAVALHKLRREDNTCFRCRKCGHIFSPGRQSAAGAR